jgi:hypothetical protein
VFLESALEGEMDAHLGYAKHDSAGDNTGNSRNGRRAKTVIAEVGPVEITVPRDRDASFDPVPLENSAGALTWRFACRRPLWLGSSRDASRRRLHDHQVRALSGGGPGPR